MWYESSFDFSGHRSHHWSRNVILSIITSRMRAGKPAYNGYFGESSFLDTDFFLFWAGTRFPLCLFSSYMTYGETPTYVNTSTILIIGRISTSMSWTIRYGTSPTANLCSSISELVSSIAAAQPKGPGFNIEPRLMSIWSCACFFLMSAWVSSGLTGFLLF